MSRFALRALSIGRQALLVGAAPQRALFAPRRLLHQTAFCRETTEKTESPEAPEYRAIDHQDHKFKIPATPALSEEELTKLPYFVRRSTAGGLPFYRKSSFNRSREWITIKKVQGDRQLMAKELAQDLGVPQDDVTVTPVSLNIHIKGHALQEKIGDWLIKKGF